MCGLMHGATEYLTHQSLKHSLGRAFDAKADYGSVVPLPALGKSQTASLAALNNWPRPIDSDRQVVMRPHCFGALDQ